MTQREQIKRLIRPAVFEWMGGFIGTPNFNSMCDKCDMPMNACTCDLDNGKEKNTKAKLPKGLNYMKEAFSKRELKEMIRSVLKEGKDIKQVQLNDIEKAYQGKTGCRCGCRGRYYYTEGPDSTPTSKRNAQKILDYIKQFPGEVDQDNEYIDLEQNGKAWTIYFK